MITSFWISSDDKVIYAHSREVSLALSCTQYQRDTCDSSFFMQNKVLPFTFLWFIIHVQVQYTQVCTFQRFTRHWPRTQTKLFIKQVVLEVILMFKSIASELHVHTAMTISVCCILLNLVIVWNTFCKRNRRLFYKGLNKCMFMEMLLILERKSLFNMSFTSSAI